MKIYIDLSQFQSVILKEMVDVEFGEYSYGRRSEPAEEYGDYAGDYADEPAEADEYGYGPAEESVDYGEYDQSIAPTD